MTTTHLFVELLVIGFGALLWVGLLAAAAFGFAPLEVLDSVGSIALLFPVLMVTYVLGILVDRVADWSLDRFDKQDRAEQFEKASSDGDPDKTGLLPKNPKERYFVSRRLMALHGRALWDHLEYGRSRARICRGWVINSAGLLVPSSLTWWSSRERLRPLGGNGACSSRRFWAWRGSASLPGAS